MSLPGDVKTEIAAIKERIQQIQIDIGQLVSSTDPKNVTADKADEFRRISEELATLRTKLAFIMGRPPR